MSIRYNRIFPNHVINTSKLNLNNSFGDKFDVEILDNIRDGSVNLFHINPVLLINKN